MELKGGTVGTFIDAVYAIAVTILALELPSEISNEGLDLSMFSSVVLEYGVAFFLLFAFWLQHRRINGLVEVVERFGLLVNATILMLVCLVPRATMLVFDYGEDVTIHDFRESLLGSGWTRAELVDLFYVGVVVLLDLAIVALLTTNTRQAEESRLLVQLRLSKRIVTLTVLAVLVSSFLLPVENRYFLLVVPVVLSFEVDLSRLLSRADRSETA